MLKKNQLGIRLSFDSIFFNEILELDINFEEYFKRCLEAKSFSAFVVHSHLIGDLALVIPAFIMPSI